MTGIRSLEDIRDRCFIDDITGCWHWRGALANTTPSMRIPDLGRSLGAGAAICFLTTGEPPAPGVVWHRTCRTMLCVCPEHRVAGNRKSQMAFMNGRPKAAGVKARIAATCRAKSRFSDAVVEEIRASDETGKAIAERIGMSITHACRIRRHEIRARLDGSVFGWRP